MWRSGLMCCCVMWGVVFGLVACSSSGLAGGPVAATAQPTTVPTTSPLKLTGTLEGGLMAIGGETTGWMFISDDHDQRLEADVSQVREQAERLSGQRVTVWGQMIEKDYVERGPTAVLVISRIEAAK